MSITYLNSNILVLKICFIFYHMDVCICRVRVCACECVIMEARGIRSPELELGVTDDCEPPDLGSLNQTRPL